MNSFGRIVAIVDTVKTCIPGVKLKSRTLGTHCEARVMELKF